MAKKQVRLTTAQMRAKVAKQKQIAAKKTATSMRAARNSRTVR